MVCFCECKCEYFIVMKVMVNRKYILGELDENVLRFLSGLCAHCEMQLLCVVRRILGETSRETAKETKLCPTSIITQQIKNKIIYCVIQTYFKIFISTDFSKVILMVPDQIID